MQWQWQSAVHHLRKLVRKFLFLELTGTQFKLGAHIAEERQKDQHQHQGRNKKLTYLCKRSESIKDLNANANVEEIYLKFLRLGLIR